MYRYHLTCFLALLIALQSVLVIADTHELSQINSVHVEPKHAHELFSSKDKSHISEQKGATFEQFFDDCQHCCHCHGHASLVLLNVNLQMMEEKKYWAVEILWEVMNHVHVQLLYWNEATKIEVVEFPSKIPKPLVC